MTSPPDPVPLDTLPRGIVPLLQVAVVVAMVAALVGTVSRGVVSEVAGGVAVATIVATPLARVLILGLHWARQRDLRYAVAAGGLLIVAGSGALLALF